MAERITKLQRWLDLIAFLVGRRLPVAVGELMEGIPAYAERWVTGSETDRASIRRTFERDKDELRKLGIPIDTVEYRINYGKEVIDGYVLRRRDFYLPYLKLVAGEGKPSVAAASGERLPELELSEEEAELAFMALREAIALPAFPLGREARAAFRKIAFDLDPDAFEPSPVIHVDRPGSEEILERMRPLSDALVARKRVVFDYHGLYRGETTHREVYPYGLFFQRGSWYLTAHDVGRGDTRVFRVGRMDAVEVNRKAPNSPDYSIPRDFSLDTYLRRDAWELGDEEPLRARVLFHFPRSLWAERNRYGTLIEQREDGAATREFEVRQTNPFVRWVLTLGMDAELLEPEDLATEFRTIVRRTAGLYGEVH